MLKVIRRLNIQALEPDLQRRDLLHMGSIMKAMENLLDWMDMFLALMILSMTAPNILQASLVRLYSLFSVWSTT